MTTSFSGKLFFIRSYNEALNSTFFRIQNERYYLGTKRISTQRLYIVIDF